MYYTEQFMLIKLINNYLRWKLSFKVSSVNNTLYENEKDIIQSVTLKATQKNKSKFSQHVALPLSYRRLAEA